MKPYTSGQESKDRQKKNPGTQTRSSRKPLILVALLLLVLIGIGIYIAAEFSPTEVAEPPQAAAPQDPQPKPLNHARIHEHLTAAVEKALTRDLAEADAYKDNHWQWQKLTDAAYAAHQQHLSLVNELANEFASIDTGDDESATFNQMLRVLDEEGIDAALAYLSSKSTRLLQQATAKSEASRKDLRPLLAGARIAIANSQPEKAETLFQELLAPGLPDWPQARHEYIDYLLEIKGPRQQTLGNLTDSLATYTEAERQSSLLMLQAPENTEWQHLLSVTRQKIGDIAAAHDELGKFSRSQDDLTAAALAHTASMEIRRKLAGRDPENTRWQRHLFYSYNKLASVSKEQGDLTAAGKAAAAGIEITKALAARDPDNTTAQSNLAISHERVGDVAMAQGDLSAAAEAYTAALEIRKKLADSNPDNNSAWDELSVSHYKFGEIAEAQGDLTAATKAYTAALEISEALTADHPDNIRWQRIHSSNHSKLGNMAKAQGNLSAATKSITDDGKHLSQKDLETLATLKTKLDIR